MKVGVFGLGYVGTVSLGCLAAHGHELTGVDVNKTKVDMINNGNSPVMETGLDDLIAEGWKKGRIKAVASAEESVPYTDISLVCVGTPRGPDGDLDLVFVERVCKEIGRALLKSKGYHIVAIRSTLLPGITENLLIPTLESHSGYRAGHDFGVCYNPEFLREGSAIHDFHNPPFTVIGEYDKRGIDTCAELFQGINSTPHIVPIKTAEMVKYACNAFHALKVAFSNEIGNICKKEEIDSHQVMDIFCMDRILNISPSYLRPGFAFGGSCLPKDLRALIRFSEQHKLNVPVLDAILLSNHEQIRRGVDLVKQTGRTKIGLLGVSFKAGTDDLRESPFVELAGMLLELGLKVLIYDKDVAADRLIGANKDYIEQRIPGFSSLLCKSPDDILKNCGVIVVCSAGDDIPRIIHRARKDQYIIDLVRAIEEPGKIAAHYQGICW